MRTLFVTTTMDHNTAVTAGLLSDPNSEPSTIDLGYSSPKYEDQPLTRARFRGIFGLGALFSLIPVILGIVVGYQYPKAETNSDTASSVQSMRYDAGSHPSNYPTLT